MLSNRKELETGAFILISKDMHYNPWQLLFLLLAALLIASCATYTAVDYALVEYSCEDIVVVGRAKNVGHSDLKTEDDLLDHSIFEIEISIKQVWRGNEHRKIVQAFGISHAPLREDKDFVFVLSPRDRRYEVKTASLFDDRGHVALAASCS